MIEVITSWCLYKVKNKKNRFSSVFPYKHNHATNSHALWCCHSFPVAAVIPANLLIEIKPLIDDVNEIRHKSIYFGRTCVNPPLCDQHWNQVAPSNPHALILQRQRRVMFEIWHICSWSWPSVVGKPPDFFFFFYSGP